MKDKEKLMKKLVKSKLVYANMNFSGIDGLKYYDDGYVKEGIWIRYLIYLNQK